MRPELAYTLLGVALGISGSYATLGRQITRALTLLEAMDKTVGAIDKRVGVLETVPHFHRRKDDVS